MYNRDSIRSLDGVCVRLQKFSIRCPRKVGKRALRRLETLQESLEDSGVQGKWDGCQGSYIFEIGSTLLVWFLVMPMLKLLYVSNDCRLVVVEVRSGIGKL
ncbi:hypothetical protein BT96DRAFT_463088 [Gymnopus androsaceus JB14]|uniref:Uncharacterized protein n=1 Tax=Gymnopus androsaceus JB14 TaxID=1447944 RepID=A0A6A4IHI7_9AGAR|nr:hypothetical protein BT96DRAFT_463088 [Gymnopus androsaceus JB14]